MIEEGENSITLNFYRLFVIQRTLNVWYISFKNKSKKGENNELYNFPVWVVLIPKLVSNNVNLHLRSTFRLD